MKKPIHLICLPFAGGNKFSYRQYAEKAPPFLHITTLEYSGRGSRIKEPLMPDIHKMTDDLYNQIRNKVDHINYAIYGHSLGGLLAYLLTRKLLQNNHKAPLHLFITGTSGPSAPERLEKKRSLLNKEDFIKEIKEFGGMPDEILQNEELLYFFEPILRSDFKASENYFHTPQAPFNIPVTVITGTDEDMEKEEIETWQKETTQVVDFKVMEGNHFFIYNYIEEILGIISNKFSFYSKANHI